jgi:putative chitinase
VITEADLKKFAPRCRPEYRKAFLDGQEVMAAAGIFDSELRLVHFMGQFGAETNGGTVVRESLTYTTAKRLREVWPARFRDKSDAALRPLLKNPVALGDSVYGGRMGNGKSNGDGFKYRGGGMLQTTGKSAVMKYASGCEMDCGDAALASYLDDCLVTLRFACLEWEQAGCNRWADENSIRKVSKAINTGSATSNIEPVGMEHRKDWFAKAWGVWGDKGKPDNPKKKRKIGKKEVLGGTAGGVVAGKLTEAATNSAPAPTAPPQQHASAAERPAAPDLDPLAQVEKGLSTATKVQSFADTGKAVSSSAWLDPIPILIALAAIVAVFGGKWLWNKYQG